VAFHRHFNAISPFCLLPFDDAPKIAVKQKASGTWKVQSAGCTEFGVRCLGVRGPECRIQSEICEKNAPFKGIRQSVGNRLLVCPVACSLMHLTVFSGPTCHLEPSTRKACSSLCPLVGMEIPPFYRHAMPCHAILSPIRRL